MYLFTEYTVVIRTLWSSIRNGHCIESTLTEYNTISCVTTCWYPSLWDAAISPGTYEVLMLWILCLRVPAPSWFFQKVLKWFFYIKFFIKCFVTTFSSCLIIVMVRMIRIINIIIQTRAWAGVLEISTSTWVDTPIVGNYIGFWTV